MALDWRKSGSTGTHALGTGPTRAQGHCWCHAYLHHFPSHGDALPALLCALHGTAQQRVARYRAAQLRSAQQSAAHCSMQQADHRRCRQGMAEALKPVSSLEAAEGKHQLHSELATVTHFYIYCPKLVQLPRRIVNTIL